MAIDMITSPAVKEIESGTDYGKFEIEPLEPGFGVTLGNSLRRVLLSSLPGAAITSVSIEGIAHEFSSIENVKEDVTEILLNIKEINVLSHSADMIIEVYALESALLRTEKLVATRGEDECAPVDITRVYASDAADRMEHSARQVVAAMSNSGEAGSFFAGVRRLTSHATFNTVAARRRIADSVIKAGRYYL